MCGRRPRSRCKPALDSTVEQIEKLVYTQNQRNRKQD